MYSWWRELGFLGAQGVLANYWVSVLMVALLRQAGKAFPWPAVGSPGGILRSYREGWIWVIYFMIPCFYKEFGLDNP